MQRLSSATRATRDERGAVAVTVALLIIPLLVCFAFVVDAGILHWEKGQLQNGADAAALAVAQDCAAEGTACVAGAGALATGIAGDNANDGQAATEFDELTVNPGSGTVRVVATTLNDEGSTIRHPFASMVAPGASTMIARAAVEWGSPVSGFTIPLAVAECELTRHFNPGTEEAGEPFILELIGPGKSPKKPAECAPGYPGGFGWLEGEDTDGDGTPDCEVEVEAGVAEPGVPGSSDTKAGGCPNEYLSQLLGETVLVPLYDAYTEGSAGSHGSYNITRFAAFRITGHHVASGACLAPGVKEGAGCYLPGEPEKPRFAGGQFGIRGSFVRYVAIGEDFELGEGGTDGGLTVVRFID